MCGGTAPNRKSCGDSRFPRICRFRAGKRPGESSSHFQRPGSGEVGMTRLKGFRTGGIDVEAKGILFVKRLLRGDDRGDMGVFAISKTSIHAEQGHEFRRLKVMPKLSQHFAEGVFIERGGCGIGVAFPLNPDERPGLKSYSSLLRGSDGGFAFLNEGPVTGASFTSIPGIPVRLQGSATEGDFDDREGRFPLLPPLP